MFKKCKKIKIALLGLSLFFGQSFAVVPSNRSSYKFSIFDSAIGMLERQVGLYVLRGIGSLYDEDTISGRTAVGGFLAAGFLYSYYYKISLFSMKDKLFGVVRSSPGTIKKFVKNYPITSSVMAIGAAYGTYSHMNGSNSMRFVGNTTSDTIKIWDKLQSRVTILSYMELIYNSLARKQSQQQAQNIELQVSF
jgi:hypothetical protein